jgi:hypothetical protein
MSRCVLRPQLRDGKVRGIRFGDAEIAAIVRLDWSEREEALESKVNLQEVDRSTVECGLLRCGELRD